MVEPAKWLGVTLLPFSSLDALGAIIPPGILIAHLWWKPGDTMPLLILQR
jgi:hypothetical protein